MLFSCGGVALAALLLVLGLVMASNANFAKNYVKEQLGEQKITFKSAETLTAEEKQSPCVVTYAGQPQRETLFKGETLRGLLLTSFGFSVFGVKGEQVANVAFIAAALLLLLSLAGIVHAYRAPKDRTFAASDQGRTREGTPLVGV